MSYGDFEWLKEQADYWYKAYREANKKASAAIAEAKKSKERELTAIRMMLKLKPFEKAIEEIAELHQSEIIRYADGFEMPVCASCESDNMPYPWPCPTAEILEEWNG